MPRWLLYTLLTMLLWGGWTVASKPVSNAVSAWEVQCLSTAGVLPVLVILGASGRLGSGTNLRRGLLLAVVAGIICGAGNVAYYRALAAGGKAAAVTPLTALYPLVTIFLAMLVLRERLNWVQWLGVVLSLLALVCFNVGGPDEAFLTPWLAVALIPIVLWGVSALFQKLASGHGGAEVVTFGFLLGFIPVAAAMPIFHPVRLDQPLSSWTLLILVGLLFALGNYTLIFAYGSGGSASVVTPMASLYSLVTIPLAMVLLHERVGYREGIGIVLALMAVVALARETPPAQRRPAESGVNESR